MGNRISNSSYRRLTPSERFRLAIDAHARGDVVELQRLSDTCPEQKYWSQDINYSERMKASLVVALSAANFLLRARLAFEPAIGAKEMHEGLLEAVTVLPAVADELAASQETVMIGRAYADRATDLVGVCEGVRRFSSSIGLLPEKLLGLERNCLGTWDFACQLAEVHPSNEAIAVAIYRCLSKLWAALVPTGGAGPDVSASAA